MIRRKEHVLIQNPWIMDTENTTVHVMVIFNLMKCTWLNGSNWAVHVREICFLDIGQRGILSIVFNCKKRHPCKSNVSFSIPKLIHFKCSCWPTNTCFDHLKAHTSILARVEERENKNGKILLSSASLFGPCLTKKLQSSMQCCWSYRRFHPCAINRSKFCAAEAI